MKKVILILMSLCIILNLFVLVSVSASAEEVFTSGDYRYTVADNKATITLYIGNAKDVIIPSKLDGKYVVSIGNYAFYDLDFNSVVIPNSVINIGDNAFQNNAYLSNVTIGENVVSIGNEAFENCNFLSNVTMPKKVSYIGFKAFGYYHSYNDSQDVIWHKADGFKIIGFKNSKAQKYAVENNFKFSEITLLKLKSPKVKITSGKKQIKIKYTKAKNVVGFQVRYKIKGKWVTKTFNTKKSATKTIKNLKKGKYKVQIRVFTKGKKAYSSWSKTKTVKVK